MKYSALYHIQITLRMAGNHTLIFNKTVPNTASHAFLERSYIFRLFLYHGTLLFIRHCTNPSLSGFRVIRLTIGLSLQITLLIYYFCDCTFTAQKHMCMHDIHAHICTQKRKVFQKCLNLDFKGPTQILNSSVTMICLLLCAKHGFTSLSAGS